PPLSAPKPADGMNSVPAAAAAAPEKNSRRLIVFMPRFSRKFGPSANKSRRANFRKSGGFTLLKALKGPLSPARVSTIPPRPHRPQAKSRDRNVRAEAAPDGVPGRTAPEKQETAGSPFSPRSPSPRSLHILPVRR